MVNLEMLLATEPRATENRNGVGVADLRCAGFAVDAGWINKSRTFCSSFISSRLCCESWDCSSFNPYTTFGCCPRSFSNAWLIGLSEWCSSGKAASSAMAFTESPGYGSRHEPERKMDAVLVSLSKSSSNGSDHPKNGSS
ncbi:hypothetical protein OGAPHI_007429 [Ogataea philodendri]|uniref:Uncharacterized protein n=1 Tax=Ogataea philodendri TaxID=1378263 RepID=A0A9P8NWB2_9ASCO|nr:uncharacterized protein OGAPHI_007429 [Ogataea philodendri]KAH3660224.1 hypothetical protein OGAPHI_007429 [Ogataea philodendri]